MAWPLTDNSLIRITQDGASAGEDIRNIFWWQITNTAGAPTSNVLGDDWRTLMRSGTQGLYRMLGDQYTLTQTKFELMDGVDVSNPAKPFFTSSEAPAIVLGQAADDGTRVGDHLPSYCAAQITLYTSKKHTSTNRTIIGGNRYAPLLESDTDPAKQGNALVAGTIVLLQDFVLTLQALHPLGNGGGTYDARFCVGSPKWWVDEGFPPGSGFPLVDTLVVRPKITSQVSRKAG